MNGNEFYYKKLKKNESVQNILHESDSIIYCSNCSRKIMSENYCSKCGKNSIVIKKVDPNYFTSFVKGSQKYAKTAKTQTDFLVYWTQSKLEKFNIFISEEPVYSRSKYHKIILNLLRVISIFIIINTIFLNLSDFNLLRMIMSVGKLYFLGILIFFTPKLTGNSYFKNTLLLLYLSIVDLIFSFIFFYSSVGWTVILSIIFLLLITTPTPKIVSIFDKFSSVVSTGEHRNDIHQEQHSDFTFNQSLDKSASFSLISSTIGGVTKILLTIAVLIALFLGGIFYTTHSADGSYSLGMKGAAELKLNILFVHVDGEILVLGKSQKFQGSVDWINQKIEINLPVAVPGIGDKISGTYEKDDQGNLKIGVGGVNQVQLKRN